MPRRLMTPPGWRIAGWTAAALLAAGAAWQFWPNDVQAETNLAPKSVATADVDGRELFHRSWLADDPRSPAGDGLGPMFNETSCAGCHNQGGPGGGGSTEKNVELLTAFVSQPQVRFDVPMMGGSPMPQGFSGGNPGPNGGSGFVGGSGFAAFPGNPPQDRQAILEELKQIHPDFAKSSSVVIHRFGTSAKHNQWRSLLLTAQVPQQMQAINTTALNFDGATALGQPFAPPQDAVQVDTAETPANATFAPAVPGDQGRTEPTPPTSSPDPLGPPTAQELTPSGAEPVQTLPATQPVPFNGIATFPQQFATPQMVPSSTGIPLVDEALQEIRRLQQEARQDLSGQLQRSRVILLRSQRNTSALFGAGAIDAIPDSVIEAAANAKHEDFPRVSGRIHRLTDNKIGKFGWKAQKSTLREFTLAACANELGLDVRGHAQPVAPYEAHETKGHDMTDKEADALVAYVKNLPAPIQETPNDEEAAKVIEEGKKLFESVGCSVCHKQDMGEAKGIYSDLLLHDMGEQLQASGSYGSSFIPQEFDPNSNPIPSIPGSGPGPATTPGGDAFAPEEGSGSAAPPQDTTAQPGEPQAGNQPAPPQAGNQPAPPQAAASGEWRTAPLWGLRDSAPYLHDGRAMTIEQAIAIHGGEGSDSAIRFFMLPAKQQQRTIAFLKTLRAPEQHTAAK